jgi:hypothetical protein
LPFFSVIVSARLAASVGALDAVFRFWIAAGLLTVAARAAAIWSTVRAGIVAATTLTLESPVELTAALSSVFADFLCEAWSPRFACGASADDDAFGKGAVCEAASALIAALADKSVLASAVFAASVVVLGVASEAV